MPDRTSPPAPTRERYVEGGCARLYVREVGDGPPIVVVHGGPDFDHAYLRPEMDRLSRHLRVVYYDQRGRGRSFFGEAPDTVTLASEVDDLDRVRASLGVESVAVLGHSWGGVLAMEYAIRHPGRVSHLVLVDTAPATHSDALAVREEVQRRRTPEELVRLRTLGAEPAYLAGDPDADTAFYRVHFAVAFRNPVNLDQVVARLRQGFTADGVLVARAIEQRLYEETWDRDDYDLLPALGGLSVPTLVVHGEHDFIPVEVARRIALAVPQSRLVIVPDSGHFPYVERPDEFCAAVATWVRSSRASDGDRRR